MDGRRNPAFQFHKGTIRTKIIHWRLRIAIPFQFHKGTIRTDTPNGNLSHYSNFNSIKVRLELVLLEYTKPKDVLFQFHKGTIRTYGFSRQMSGYIISIP